MARGVNREICSVHGQRVVKPMSSFKYRDRDRAKGPLLRRCLPREFREVQGGVAKILRTSAVLLLRALVTAESARQRMAQFKGTIFISTKIFTEQRFGLDAPQRCLERLPESDRAVLANVTAIGWYPIEPVLRYHHALQELYGKVDGFGVCEEAGRFGAKWSLSTVMRALLRFRSPDWVMHKYASVWNRHHDSGRWEVGKTEHQNSMSGKLFDFQVQDPAFCARLRGWLHGAIAMTGGRQVEVAEPSCRCRGDAYCQFESRWG